MQELMDLAIKAGAHAARYSMLLQKLIEATAASMQSAHHGPGTNVYRHLDDAPHDLHLEAKELDEAGRQLVAALVELMEEGLLYGQLFRRSDQAIVRGRLDDEDPGRVYTASKVDQHPAVWPTPYDWMLLVADMPEILAQLAGTATA